MLVMNTAELISYLHRFPLTYRNKTEIVKAVIDEVCNYYSNNNYRPIEDDPVNYVIARVDLHNFISLAGIPTYDIDAILDEITEEIHLMVMSVSTQLENYFSVLPVDGRVFPTQVASSHVINFVDNETLRNTEEDERAGEIRHLRMVHYEEMARVFKEWMRKEDLERLIPIPRNTSDLLDEFLSELSYTLEQR